MLTFEATVADGRPTSRRPFRAQPRCAPHCAALCTEAGLAAAYRTHSRDLAGFCRRALTDSWLAEEITQEVFLKAWRNCARFDGREGPRGQATGTPMPEQLRPWLFAIARNAVVDAVRHRARRPGLVPGPEHVDHHGDPFDQYARFDDADLVRAGLDTLPPAKCAALVAVFIDGLSYEQAAARLGVPVGTVKSRVFSALRALRVALGGCRDTRSIAS
jgi:RNA polymerase sigma-70 factor (ECF subfamily)